MDRTFGRRVIVVGGGRVGRRVGRRMAERSYTVTVIERDETQAERLPEPLASGVVVGDAADEDVLAEADPASAAFVAALTDDTATNLRVCELARELAPDVETLLRIGEDGEQDYAYLDHVSSVVYPAAAGASVAVERMTDDGRSGGER